MNPELQSFITHARERGMDHATIRMLLLSAGWKEKDVAQALTEQALDLPVPAPPDTGGAREAFLHLLAFSALYTWVIAVVLLLLRYVDHHVHDAAGPELSETMVRSGLRWSVAVVLVAFPAFLVFARITIREIERNAEKARSGIRRWLTYLTLLAAAIALGSDLITLVYRLLDGGLTARFLLKVLVVLVVAGGVFAYYLLAVAGPGGRSSAAWINQRFGWAATTLVATTVIWGLVLVGSPAAERQRRLDERRVENLRTIRDQMRLICVERNQPREGTTPALKRPLPDSLAELAGAARSRRPDVQDPATQEPYDYEILGASRYRICASFDLPRDEPYEPFWNHSAGRQCFDLDVFEDD